MAMGCSVIIPKLKYTLINTLKPMNRKLKKSLLLNILIQLSVRLLLELCFQTNGFIIG